MNNNIIGSCVKLIFTYNIDSIKMIIIAFFELLFFKILILN